MPVWYLRLATDKEGQIIHDWHWLPDSNGVAFVQRVMGKERLVIANIRQVIDSQSPFRVQSALGWMIGILPANLR